MRHLTVFRHAKSSWSSSAKSDHARPLTPRGIKAAIRMGHWLLEHDLLPDRILCSTAKRARETRKLAAKLWPIKPDVMLDKELYLASSTVLIDLIAKHGTDAQRLMVIGHNPGLQDLIIKLADQRPRDTREIIGKYPSGAIADLACNVDEWSELDKDCATLTTFMRPRALG